MESVWFSKPRPGSGQPLGLSREAIVRKAVQMLDEHGLQKLSMRKLAAELGAAPMSLYWHVPTKDALMELCLDDVFGELEPPDSEAGWETALRGMMHSLRHLALRHPWWVKTIGEYMSIGPNAVGNSDAMLEPLRNAGFSAVDASQSVSTLSSFVIGFTLAEVNFGDRGRLDVAPPEVTKFANLYRDRFPRYVEMMSEPELWSLDKQFEFGLDCILDGIKARVAASR